MSRNIERRASYLRFLNLSSIQSETGAAGSRSVILLIIAAVVYNIGDRWPTGLIVRAANPLLVQDLAEFKLVTSGETFCDLRPKPANALLVMKDVILPESIRHLSLRKTPFESTTSTKAVARSVTLFEPSASNGKARALVDSVGDKGVRYYYISMLFTILPEGKIKHNYWYTSIFMNYLQQRCMAVIHAKGYPNGRQAVSMNDEGGNEEVMRVEAYGTHYILSSD
ncbi:hypothetical protein WA026_014090 [Henosepilachna vigintioctopunctata]|uniref:Uncharacterized protein n=1 Tax=Henosepilachna vigintioctopunctata TaxID=420089 RepID=A0AAW1TKC4_9CUCU